MLEKYRELQITIKIDLSDLELLIEIMERNRRNDENESKLRTDFKKIRSYAEEEIEKREKELALKPLEDKRLKPNPITKDED